MNFSIHYGNIFLHKTSPAFARWLNPHLITGRLASFMLAICFGITGGTAAAIPIAPQEDEKRISQASPDTPSASPEIPENRESAMSAISGSRFPGIIDHLLLRPVGNDDQNEIQPQIHINYPSTGNREVDSDIRSWVTNLANVFSDHLDISSMAQTDMPPDETIAKFLQDDDLNIPEEGQNSHLELWGDYNISRPSPNALSITFEIWNYTGTGQNNLDILTLNYNLLNGQRLELVDIFENPELALTLMSNWARQQLEPRLGAGRRTRMLLDGTEPLPENFSSLTLTADGICINFQPWQVAPWEAGIQKVKIPLEKLLEAGPLLTLWNK